jgi:hypothetical protein
MLATTTAVVSMVAKHTRCTEIPQFPDYSNAAAIAVNLATKGRKLRTRFREIQSCKSRSISASLATELPPFDAATFRSASLVLLIATIVKGTMLSVRVAAVVYRPVREHGAVRNRGAVERDDSARYT